MALPNHAPALPNEAPDERLRREVIEGCRAMADVYLEIEREYHPLEEEADAACD